MAGKKLLVVGGLGLAAYYAYSKGLIPGAKAGIKKTPAGRPTITVAGLSISGGNGVLQLTVFSPVPGTITSVVRDIEDDGTRIATVNFNTPVKIPAGSQTLQYNIKLDLTGVASDVINAGVNIASNALQAWANSQANSNGSDDSGTDTDITTDDSVNGLPTKEMVSQLVKELHTNTGTHHLLNDVIHFGNTDKPMVSPAVARQMGLHFPAKDNNKKLVPLTPDQTKIAIKYLATIDSDLFVDDKKTGILNGISLGDTHVFTVSGTMFINNQSIPFSGEIGAATI